MATQKVMETVSFRFPPGAMKQLKKHSQYTTWVKNLVLANLGLCPLCGQGTQVLIRKNKIEEMVRSNGNKK